MVEKSSFAALDDPPIVYATPIPSSATADSFLTDWSCPKCTLLNSISNANCDLCYFPNPNFAVTLNNRLSTTNESYNHITENRSQAPSQMVGSFNPNDNCFRKNMDTNLDLSCMAASGLESVLLISNGDIHDVDIHEEEDPHSKKVRRRLRRKRRMAVGGVTGCLIGSVLLCFPGAVLGAITGVWGARILSKRREKLKDERMVKERLASAQTEAGAGTERVNYQ
jgi:hypothetical protein